MSPILAPPSPLLWLRVEPHRRILEQHLQHVEGTFRAAGWEVHRGGSPPLPRAAPLAVMDDPWLEPLPEQALALVGARTSHPLRWRLPRVAGLPGEQGWHPRRGPYTGRDYRRLPGARASSRTLIGRPLANPWTGFAVAAPREAESLLAGGWPPAASEVVLVSAVTLFRYDDPADHERREIDPLVPEAARCIVDVGCGHGRFGERLRRPERRVVGIEPSPGMAVEAARRLDLVLATGAEVGLASLRGPVDCVIFADVLEHLADPAEALRRCTDLLDPSGRVVVSIPDAAWAPVLRALAAGRWQPTLAGVQARDHLAVFTRGSFEELARECGLEVEREVPLAAPLPLGLRLWAWLAARTAGGDPRRLLTPQWLLSLRRR